MEYIELGYIGLFLICFLSATILPLTSEGVLLLFLINGFDPLFCLIIATIGNSIGGSTNYFIGRMAKTKTLERFVKDGQRRRRLILSVKKHGIWIGLIAWTPIIGDPLMILTGFFRVRMLPLFALMAIGKMLRYSLIILLWS